MPRFDLEGFNPEKRIDNDLRDRTVGDTFDYVDDDDVIDNQNDQFDLSKSIDEFSNYDHQSTEKIQQKKPGQKKGKPNKRRKKMSVAKRIIAIILAIILLFVGTFCSVLCKVTYNDKRSNQYVSSSELYSSSSVKNILLIGVDARSSDDDESSRSDTMMLISIDSKHNCIKMISFLRDTWVYIPAINSSAKLNAACSYDGYNGVVDTIEYNFGIDIDGYVVADFEMFQVLVDSIGGVEIEVSESEANEVTNHPKRYGNVTLEAGTYTLTGEQALAYCRIRKIDSDFMRTYRQRVVMQAIISGVKSASPFSLAKMAFSSAKYIETDLSKAQIIALGARVLTCLSNDMVETKVPFDNTWSYQTISGQSVISINLSENKEQLKKFIYDLSADEIIEMQDD